MIAHPIHPSAVRVLEKLGGDASDFSARPFSAKIAGVADLIITMTTRHREEVLTASPRMLRRTFVLTEAAEIAARFVVPSLDHLADLRSYIAAEERPDIPDPIGQGADVFDFVGAQIANCIPPILEMVRRWQ